MLSSASRAASVAASTGRAFLRPRGGGKGIARTPKRVPLCHAGRCSLSSNSSSSSSSSSDSLSTTFSSYEYPDRTEAPTITMTNAQDVIDDASLDTPPSSSEKKHKIAGKNDDDPFDDSGSLTMEERHERRMKQRQQEQQNNDDGSPKLSSLPITDRVPDFVPSNVPSEQLQVPETHITRLDNGIRVVSQETYGQMCTVGVLTNVGSRHEPPKTPGMVHLLETMAFGSTKNFQGLEITQLLQDWGATRFVSHSREQTLHCIDILRPNVQQGVELLADVVLEPLIQQGHPEEFIHALDVLAFQAQEQPPELVLGEALQEAAYGPEQQLGKLHFATHEAIAQFTPQSVQEFYDQAVRNNPNGMVVAGAGISHDELVELTETSFGHIQQVSAPTTVPSEYKGGSHFIGKPSQPSIYTPAPEEEYCRVALAFPVGGWHSKTMVTACVLQTLLGGGSSFSAGGPGKGMYSRIYQQVLNRYGWMETAEAFTTFADEGGLFGLSASTSYPGKVPELVTILADQLARLAIEPVNEVELSRARNMLKCNVLTQLESRLILFEDMGRQVLTYGKREDATTTCQKIDSVTPEDIQSLVEGMLYNHKPTLAATGSHLDQVPPHETVTDWFKILSGK